MEALSQVCFSFFSCCYVRKELREGVWEYIDHRFQHRAFWTAMTK